MQMNAFPFTTQSTLQRRWSGQRGHQGFEKSLAGPEGRRQEEHGGQCRTGGAASLQGFGNDWQVSGPF